MAVTLTGLTARRINILKKTKDKTLQPLMSTNLQSLPDTESYCLLTCTWLRCWLVGCHFYLCPLQKVAKCAEICIFVRSSTKRYEELRVTLGSLGVGGGCDMERNYINKRIPQGIFLFKQICRTCTVGLFQAANSLPGWLFNSLIWALLFSVPTNV